MGVNYPPVAGKHGECTVAGLRVKHRSTNNQSAGRDYIPLYRCLSLTDLSIIARTDPVNQPINQNKLIMRRVTQANQRPGQVFTPIDRRLHAHQLHV